MGATTIGLVGAGAMGSAVGAAYASGSARAVTSLAGRSERTRRFVEAAGLEVLADLDEVVQAAEIVLSIVPPGSALEVGADIAAAALRTGSTPLVADLNAIAPQNARALERTLAEHGLELVDGSISGGPPRPEATTRIYLSGARAHELAELPAPGIDARVVGDAVGLASAVKMSTASVYKGRAALLAHALLTAHANGVLEPVLDDLRDGSPQLVDHAALSIARAASKADRYVGEMHEIAATQAAAGLPPELFEGVAAVYAALAETPLGRESPEDVAAAVALEDVLERGWRTGLEPATTGTTTRGSTN